MGVHHTHNQRLNLGSGISTHGILHQTAKVDLIAELIRGSGLDADPDAGLPPHNTSWDIARFITSMDTNSSTTKGPATGVASVANGGLNSIALENGGNLWAVGAGCRCFLPDNCSSMSSSIWSTTTSRLTGAAPPYQLNSVFMDSDSDGWAVGQDPSRWAPLHLVEWIQLDASCLRASGSSLHLCTAWLCRAHQRAGSRRNGHDAINNLFQRQLMGTAKWLPADAPTRILNQESMVAHLEAWAVGTSGVMMHSTTQGGTFASTTSPVQTPSPSVRKHCLLLGFTERLGRGTCIAVTANCLAINDPIERHMATDGRGYWLRFFYSQPRCFHYITCALYDHIVAFQHNTHGRQRDQTRVLTNPTPYFSGTGLVDQSLPLQRPTRHRLVWDLWRRRHSGN